jgi:hypothetical protein
MMKIITEKWIALAESEWSFRTWKGDERLKAELDSLVHAKACMERIVV